MDLLQAAFFPGRSATLASCPDQGDAMKHFRLRAAGRSVRRPAAAATLALACLSGAPSFAAVTPVHKCIENGVVTFQNTPCRPEDPGVRPTPAQLNAERQKTLREKAEADKRRAASAAASSVPGASATAPKRSK
jgi:hypothetical protein